MIEINKMLKLFHRIDISKKYGMEVDAVWKETATCEIEKRIRIRWNAAVQYQKNIKEELISDFDVNEFLTEDFNYITIETYFNEIWKACENFDFGEIKEYNNWSKILYFFLFYSKEMAQYEEELYDDSDIYIERCKEMCKRKVIRNDYYMEKGVMPQEDPCDPYSAKGSFTLYYDLFVENERSEFSLCSKLFNIPDKHSSIANKVHHLIANIELLFLYIALENEKDRLKTLAKFSNFAQRKENPQKDTKIVPLAKKADEVWKQKVFTARANKYFAKAVEVGYMQETETGYLWTFSNGLQIALAYFVRRIYQPASPQYKKLEVLFGLPHKTLKNSGYQLRHSSWFEDVLQKRRGVTKPPQWYPILYKFFANE